MSAKIKTVIIFLLIMASAVVAWFFVGRIECIAIKVKKEHAVKGVTVTGNVKSVEDAEVTTEITGIIEKILVSSGDYVKKGQILATLDRKELEGDLESSQSTLAAASATLKKDKVEYEDAKVDENRYKDLFEIGAVSKRSLEERTLRRQRIEQQLKEDEKQIDAAKGNVISAEGRLDNYVIKAPVSGIVTEKFVSTGDAVSPQKPLLRLVSPESIYLSTEVEENELDTVKEGMNALVIFDAYPDKVFKEKVFLVSKQVNPLTGTFEARIKKPDTHGLKLLVGMTLDATIVVKEFENVMIIPTDFLLEEHNKTYVYKKANSFAMKTPVTTEIFDNNRVIVKEGLKEDDIIVKRLGTGKLKENSKIKIKEYRN